MGIERSVLTFIGCDLEPEDASIVMFGAPFDSTTSYRPGARSGPQAMRSESFGIEDYSPYQDMELADARVADIGDIELPFGSASRALDMIEETAGAILDAGKRPFMLGGEHLVSLGAIRAAAARHDGLCIVHFDAHADLRDDYLGERLSHASVMRRAHEIVGDGRVFQFFIRSGTRDEFAFAASHTRMRRFDASGIDEVVREINDRRLAVYLSIDLDCLDPSAFPGTGTPEAGGVSFEEMRRAMMSVCRAPVAAADVVELAPQLDPSGSSTAVACKTVRELLLAMAAPKR